MLASGSVRGRLGYVLDPWLLYATGGFVWAYDQLTRSQFATSRVEDETLWRPGWTLGAGIGVPIGGQWSAALEYQYSNFGTGHVTFPSPAQTFASNLTLHAVQLSLNYHIGEAPALEDLGGSPWTAAGTSFLLFAIGAAIPVLPLVFASGWAAVAASATVSALALFGIGAAITVLTGRSVWRTGLRQLVLGLSAAGSTFLIGRLVGVAIG